MKNNKRIMNIIPFIEHKGDLYKVIDALLFQYYRKYGHSTMDYQNLSLFEIHQLLDDVKKRLRII